MDDVVRFIFFKLVTSLLISRLHFNLPVNVRGCGGKAQIFQF
jgi:hypothetical protein